MSAPAKFMFEVDFGRSRSPAPDSPSPALLAEAEARGYEKGHAAGRAEAAAQTERRLADAFESIAATLDHAIRELRAVEARIEAEAVEVAVAVARKLAPQLIAREPFAELAALASDCFAHLVGAPHVVIRVNDLLYPAAHERLEEIARACGFGGRLVILAEPQIEPGDCRIEWADGGLTRERSETEAAIIEAVDRYLKVRRPRMTAPDTRGPTE